MIVKLSSPIELNLEPIENAYGTSGYNSGLLRVAFARGNENLKTKNNEPIDGRRLSGGAVLANREKFRELWMKVRNDESEYRFRVNSNRVIFLEHHLTESFW